MCYVVKRSCRMPESGADIFSNVPLLISILMNKLKGLFKMSNKKSADISSIYTLGWGIRDYEMQAISMCLILRYIPILYLTNRYIATNLSSRGVQYVQVTTMNKKQIELEHDKLLDISNVESYTNPNVNNEKLLFSDFVNRLQSPKITYKKGSAGGFVGGWIENTRENKNVQTRSMITIDIDDGMDTTKVWGNVEDYTNFSCVMYSTHNSQLEEPRYRLIIPLKHPIKPELYKSVSRYIVDVMQLGVDPSSHTLSQLMNYPTCGDISQYEFYYRDCPL